MTRCRCVGNRHTCGIQNTNPNVVVVGQGGPRGPQGTTGYIGIQGVQGTQGVQGLSLQGPAGTSVSIKGSYNSYSELVTAHPTGSSGDSYIVVADLWVWTGSAWQNVGPIIGPQGVTGSQGFTGTQGSIGAQGITGSQGVQGYTGAQGLIGAQGLQGAQGTTGSQGVQGAGVSAQDVSNAIAGAALGSTDELTEGITNLYFKTSRVAYTHLQGSSSNTWVINHNLNFYPNVTVQDSAGTIYEGEISYTNLDSITVTFSSAFSGKAYLS